MSNNLVIKLHSTPIAEFDPSPAIEYSLLQKERRPGSSGTSENKQCGRYYKFTLLLLNLQLYFSPVLMMYAIKMFLSCYYYSVVGMDKDIAVINNKEAQEIVEVDEEETEALLQDNNGM